MSHYTPHTFARRCSVAAHQSLLAKEQVVLDGIDWSLGPQKRADAMIAAITALPPAARNTVNATWQEIHRMANDEGVRCLIEEATSTAGFVPDAAFQALRSHHDRVIWFWCNLPKIWVTSRRLAATEELSNTRYWHERSSAPAKPPIHDAQACADLGAALSSAFAGQLRGQQYRIEPHAREDGSCCYYAILKDLPTTEEVFSGTDLVPTVRERVFEVVVWCPAQGGKLACHIEGGADRKLREAVYGAFSQAVFKEPLPALIPRHPMGERWHLDQLLTQASLKADPASGATHGRILAVTVTALSRGNEQITFEADPDKTISMADQIRAWVNQQNIPLSSLRVQWVKLCLEWPNQGRRRRCMTWEVSRSGVCTLKSHRNDRRVVGERHMQLWGIDVPGSDRRTAQSRTAA